MDPQTAAETNFNPIWFRLKESRNLSDLEIKRIEREIEQIAKADASGALELRAYVSVHRGRMDEAKRLIERAKIGSDGVLRTTVRFLIVLHFVRKKEDLLAVFLQHRSIIRNDISAIKTVSALLNSSGYAAEAESLIGDALRLGGVVKLQSLSDLAEQDASDLYAQGAPCAEFELPELSDEMRQVTKHVEEFVVSRGQKIEHSDFETIDLGDGRESTLVRYAIRATPEVVADLEWDLFGSLDPSELPAIAERQISVSLVSGQ